MGKILSIRKYHEGRAAYLDLNKKWGFLDEYGNVVISPIFYDVSDFSDGMAYVQLYDDKYNETCTYIDKNGKPINKRGYSAGKRIYEGYGTLTKKVWGSNKYKYYLTESSGAIIPCEIEQFDRYEAASRIHNSIILGKTYDIYKIERDGIRRVDFILNGNDNKLIEPFELNPKDNKLYSIMSTWDDGDFEENSIIDDEGNIIFNANRGKIVRLNDTYFMCLYNSNYSCFSSIFYIDKDDFDKDRTSCHYVYEESEYVVDAKIYDDNFIILSLGNGKKKLYSIKHHLWTQIPRKYKEIYYEDKDDYFVCKYSDNEYDYYNKNSIMVARLPIHIKYRNGVGIYKNEEISEESNSAYKYNKYYIYDDKFNCINSYPNDYLDMKLKNLDHVGDVLVGQSLYKDTTYIINPNNNFNISKFDNVYYREYVNGYYILGIDGKYSLVDRDGKYILTDLNTIENIGDNKLMVDNSIIVYLDMLKDHELEFDYSDLPYIIYNDDPNIVDINLKYLSKFVKLLDTEEDYIIVPISTKKVIEPFKNSSKEILDNVKAPVNSIMFNALINKKDLINKIRIDQEDLLQYHREMRENPEYLWNDNNSNFYKYKENWKIRDYYKKYLKYFDLADYNIDGVDISYTDFTDSNVKIDPKNKDLRGVILHDYNIKESYMLSKSYFKGCITDENTCIIRHTKDCGEIRYYFDEDKDVKTLQLINN